VLRILLGAQLRRLREARGISTEEAGYAIRGSHSKISRMELGRVGFKERDVADLLTLYGVTDPEERAPLLELAREANTPGWWHRYGDVLPNWFEPYLGLEEAASLIRAYEVQFVPGLLQSEEYARSVVLLGHSDAAEEEVERRVQVRLTRQQRFTEPGAPTLWAVLDESVLRRRIGSREVMRGQVEHLIEMCELPIAEPGLSDVVFIEQLTSALYLDKPTDVDTYMRTMNNLCVTAHRPDETATFLTKVLRET